MKRKAIRLGSLLKLLQDDDGRTANLAMAHIISGGNGSRHLLSRLQESGSPSLRKAAHQMQGILKRRQSRRTFFDSIRKSDDGIVENLADVHMLWFDEDSRPEIVRAWDSLVDEADKYGIDDLRSLTEFMTDAGFKTPCGSEIYADNYCIGCVLDDRLGVDFILASIASQLGGEFGVRTEIVRTDAGFGARSRDGKIILPGTDWATVTDCEELRTRAYSREKICRLAVSMLYLASIKTESFRYTFVLGECLSGGSTGKLGEILSHPLGRNRISRRKGLFGGKK